ncbi:MAG: glycosyltransferase family 4 protein [Bacteroidales bacterium]
MNAELKKNKRIRILMLTDGNIDQASARIRAISYIPYFENEGFSVCHLPRTPCRPHTFFEKYLTFPFIKRYLWLKRTAILFCGKWDIVFIQRLFISERILRRIKNRTFIIFDFDDAIYLPGKHSRRNIKTGIMITYADIVITSTPFLNDFVSRHNKKAFVIPSPVETDRIFPCKKEEVHKIPVIGWIGSYWTTGYLKVIEPVIQKLAMEISFTFLTIGSDPAYKIEGINHIIKPWSLENECSLINEMDIGIMPLPDDEFTRVKGGYKLYQYMAAGIPCVASPVGINSTLIRNGINGFLASSEKEWIDVLKKLLSDSRLRKTTGINARNDAVQYYDRKVCFAMLIKTIREIK